VLITDIDALVLRDPFPYMARYPTAGFLTTSDHLGNTTDDEGLESHGAIHTAFNVGYMYFRTSAMPLVEEWRTVIRSDPANKWDQGEFNRLARDGWDPGRTEGLEDRRLFYSFRKKARRHLPLLAPPAAARTSRAHAFVCMPPVHTACSALSARLAPAR
jgi:hypothetical protein